MNSKTIRRGVRPASLAQNPVPSAVTLERLAEEAIRYIAERLDLNIFGSSN